MKGIRIYEAEVNALPNGISSFAVYFDPILKELERVHWFYPSQPFSYREDESGELERVLLSISNPNNHGYIAPNTLLPRFARFVCSDWSTLLGFYTRPDFSLVSAEMMSADGLYHIEFFDKHVDLCFFSVDGAFWGFYAKNSELLLSVFNHASSLAGVKAEWVELSDFW